MWRLKDRVLALAREHGTPLFIYSQEVLADRARQLTSLKTPYGCTVRFAVKANPHHGIIALFHEYGLHFDASSSYEAAELLEQGIPGAHISLSSQQPAHNLAHLLEAGVQYVATSRHQLKLFTQTATPGSSVGLRVNPGIGAGHNNRTSTGGVASSFGLWHEYLEETLAYANERRIIINRLHLHIGSGADPSVWGEVMDTALSLVRRMPDVTILDIGGGYKISRAATEPESDMARIIDVFAKKLQDFGHETGRKIHLEIEPGTWLVGHAGVLIAEIVDIVDTGEDGYTFLRVNTGMNDFMRPAMYGAQHQMEVLGADDGQSENTANNETIASATKTYVVVGHNCETGDILTPAPSNPEAIAPRPLMKARIGDIVAIADTGAYCASFSAKGYNAFPPAKEILV